MEKINELYEHLNLKPMVDAVLQEYDSQLENENDNHQHSSAKLKLKILFKQFNKKHPPQYHMKSHTLINPAFQHRIESMTPKEYETFRTIFGHIVQFLVPKYSHKEHLSQHMIGSINEVISTIHAYCRNNYNYKTSTPPYDYFFKNIITYYHASYFGMSSFEMDANCKSISKKESKSFQFQIYTMGDLAISSFNMSNSTQEFTLPAIHTGPKEVHFSITLSHWLVPFIRYLRGTMEQEPTIRQKEAKKFTNYSEPDFIIKLANGEKFITELKRAGFVKFYNKSVQLHQATLLQIGGYIQACETNVGFLVTPHILVRVVFVIPNDSNKSMKSTRGGTNKPSFKIDTFNHYDDTKSGLLAVWYSMIQDSPPRTLNKDELKELESTLQELKAEINQHEQGKSEAGKP